MKQILFAVLFIAMSLATFDNICLAQVNLHSIQTASKGSLNLTIPNLGDSLRNHSFEKKSSNFFANPFNILRQAQTVDTTGSSVGITIVSTIIGVGVTITLIGNVAAFIAEKQMFGWGIAGVVVGGLGVLFGIITMVLPGGLVSGLILLINNAALVTFGGLNIAKANRKQRAALSSVLPWASVGVAGDFRGGYMWSTRF